MRFYVDGIELDVQDPKFFIDEDNYKETTESIEEILSYSSSSNVTIGSLGAYGEICYTP